MKKLLLLLLCVPLIGLGQTWETTFGGTGYEYAYSVQQTTDGGYIITGKTASSPNGNSDVYLIKTDGNGDSLWTKTFGDTSSDWGHSIQQTTDGGYIITGDTWSFGNGSNDVYLIKTDDNGTEQWNQTFGGIYSDVGYSVQQTTDGGYIITGWISSIGNGSDVYLIKTDANGDSLWTKTFGGTEGDAGNSVQQTTDGGYIITGTTRSFGTTFWDVYLIKTDANGDSLWTKTFGGTHHDKGHSVQQTTDGGYIITGETWWSSANGYRDVYLIKTDGNGDSLWTKIFGGTGIDVGNSVQQTTDGGYIITGETESFGNGGQDVYLIKTDANGDSLWTKTFGGTSNDYAYSVQQTTDGGYIITGRTNSFGNGGGADVYLIKTDSNGNLTTPTWDCIGGSCVNPGTGLGMYTDSLVCVSNCVPTNIIDDTNTNTQKIIKITDILGRDINPEKNKPFIEIYNDGTVEKKIIIE